MEVSNFNQNWPVKLDSSGRIMIPIEARKLHGWDQGTQLVVEEGNDGEMKIVTLEKYIERVQNHFRDKFGLDRNMVDELIRERMLEAADEQGNP